MADPHQDSGQIDTTEVHSVSDNIIILHSDHTESGIKEDMLHHHLVDGNIDSTSITYVVPTSEQSESPVTTVVTDTDTSLPSSGSGLGLRSLEEFNLHNSDASHIERSDLQSSTHSHVVQINGSVNALVNNAHSVLPATHHIIDSVRITNDEVPIRVEAPLSNNKSDSMPHELPAHTVSSYSNSSLLTDDNVTHIVQQNMDTTATNDQNQTHIRFNHANSSDTSQVDDVKTELKLHTLPHTPTVQIAAPRGISMTPEVLQSVIQQVKAQQLQLSQHSSQQTLSSQNASEGPNGSGPLNNGMSITLVSPSQQSSSAAPLGSSQNPIRIIQQGNRYTPMQQLTTEQLQQIMQVVQQQHTNNPTKAQENGGTVIFNPHTNTKIMYRVIYPSELHKSQAISGQATYQVLKPVTLSQEQQTTTNTTPLQKRPYRKRKEVTAQSSGTIVNGDEDKERASGDAAELSKEEKEERKKHRPRTRSGRVSKPPKHMVQDYKHIHVLDWDEDYDDSDGGYSDLKQSDEDSKSRQNDEGEQEASPDLFQALGAGKPKNYKCQTCEKSYIGQAGLERHYRLAPEHRRTEDGGVDSQVHIGLMVDGEDSSKEASITQDGNSRNSDPGPDTSKVNGFVDNFSEDSNTQDSINSIGTSSPVVRRGRGRGSYRGRWAHLKQNAHAKRKNKLREFIKMCSDEDLMDVLFPRLVGCISTWEFLLMKAEKGGSRPQVDIIYKEFEDLLRPLKKVCAGYMKPVAEREVHNLNSFDKVLKVHDQNLASCLGLNVGLYKVEEMLPDDSNSFSSLHNKLSAASISLSNNSNTHERLETFNPEKFVFSGKRKFELISPSKSDNIPVKKPCLMTSLSSNISSEQSLMSLNGLPSNTNESASLSTLSIHSSSPSPQSLQSSVNQSSNFIKVETSSSSQSHQSLSYFISTSNGKGNVATSQALKPQLVPVVLNTVSGANTVAVSSSQILPVVLNPQSCRTTVSSTAPGTRAGQISSLPLLLAAPGNQLQGSTIFLASGNQAASHNVLVKQPSLQTKQQSTLQQQQKQKKVSSQHHIASPISKSQILPMGSISTNGVATVAVSSSSSSIQRFDLNTKPAEVKVSRKLFHEATASSSLLPITTSSSLSLATSSSYVTSGSHPNNTILVTSPHKVKANYNDNLASVSSLLPPPSLTTSSHLDNNGHIQSASTTCSSLGNVKREMENNVLNFNSIEFNTRASEESALISVSSHGATPVSDLNREVTTGNDEDLDSSFDISAGVLSSIGFSGDELSSLNTSSDNPPSIPVSLSNLGVNQVSSVMISEMIAPSSNGVSLIQPPKTAVRNGASMNDANNADSPFINGNTAEFPTISPPPLKLKDSNIILPGSQSSSSFISSSSDFIHLLSNRPSSPLMSSPCKDGNLNNSTTPVSFNLTSMDNSPQSQILKSEPTASSMMDLGTLSFSDQSVEQLNGVASTLHSSDVDSILPEQITQSDETVNPLLELPQQLVNDDMTISAPAAEEEGQFLLTEGSNIYQTDDGAWFIQSADGNTYQLQGAQGLPMETVQALLSGNLDMNGDSQTDVMH